MVSIRYFCGVGEFCRVKSRPAGCFRSKMGAVDRAERHRVHTPRPSAANSRPGGLWLPWAVIIAASARSSLVPGADFHIGSAAIIWNVHTDHVMRSIYHKRPRGHPARGYTCVRVPTVNLDPQFTPPSSITARVRSNVQSDRVGRSFAGKLHAQKLAAPICQGLAVVLIERTLAIATGIDS